MSFTLIKNINVVKKDYRTFGDHFPKMLAYLKPQSREYQTGPEFFVLVYVKEDEPPVPSSWIRARKMDVYE